jgi:hypothetical protein
MTTARTHNTNVSTVTGTPRGRIGTPRPEGYLPPAVDADGNLEGGVIGREPVGEPFDPAEHTIDEVKDYVTAYPQDADAILEAELDGKDRSGLTSWLENFDPNTETDGA